MPYPVEADEICPSCGTQFGYSDRRKSFGELRQEWIAGGCKWFNTIAGEPRNWDALGQLINGVYIDPSRPQKVYGVATIKNAALLGHYAQGVFRKRGRRPRRRYMPASGDPALNMRVA